MDTPGGPLPDGMRYRPYSSLLRARFGCRVYKVSVDAGFTCPNRDGTVGLGGCTYCDNRSFRPAGADRTRPVEEQVRDGIAYVRTRFRADKFIVYFQPYSNTHAPLAELIPRYEAALANSDVVGLAIGTRPDCVDEGKLAWFEALARERFVSIEYGLQSIHDCTLARINRGHDSACWQRAVALTRGRNISICAHVILGFPWEARSQVLETADAVSAAGIDSVKLHHLHLVRGTALAAAYAASPFPLLSLEEYADLATDFLERLDPSIAIQRLAGLAPEADLIGPLWGEGKSGVRRAIERRLEERGTWQGRCALRQSICPASISSEKPPGGGRSPASSRCAGR